MKIDNSLKSLGGVAPSEGRSRPVRDSVASAGEPAAQVGLSSLSSTLQQAEAAAASTPAVNSARVAEIRQAIAEGRYKVNVEGIAQGLIDSTRELLASQVGSGTGKA